MNAKAIQVVNKFSLMSCFQVVAKDRSQKNQRLVSKRIQSQKEQGTEGPSVVVFQKRRVVGQLAITFEPDGI